MPVQIWHAMGQLFCLYLFCLFSIILIFIKWLIIFIYLLYGMHDFYPQCLHKMAVWGLTSDICTRTLSLLSKVLYSLKAKHKMDYICTFKHNHIAHPTSLIPTHLSPFLLQLCYQIMHHAFTFLSNQTIFFHFSLLFFSLEDKSSKRKKNPYLTLKKEP